MMSLETLRRLNTQIAVEAAEQDARPYVPFDAEELDLYPPFPFPDLGHFEPEGWQRTSQTWFVDGTGGGHGWEPALTAEQFKRELRRYVARHPGHGFAIVGTGEFQVCVGAFRPVSSNGRCRRPK